MTKINWGHYLETLRYLIVIVLADLLTVKVGTL